jgi:hypothetical protein
MGGGRIPSLWRHNQLFNKEGFFKPGCTKPEIFYYVIRKFQRTEEFKPAFNYYVSGNLILTYTYRTLH